ncbi:MAG: TonB-dependent receptor plug domain-containing protein, partial [Pseudomonadota bacterium]
MSKRHGSRRAGLNPVRLSSMLLLGAATTPFAGIALAQEDVPEAQADTEEARELDIITVTGTRQVIQDSIALKRSNTQIVDGLSAEEIGDIPALSIGEALENITGVASHRENGGATEVSIRGLGPYLSSTVVNGRAATNGSGDRSVNFSQFPSELINKLAVFKTQDASQIEGGVAGQIQLETLRPLDFGKQRFQFELKGNYNPDQQNIDDSLAGDLGYRGTLSYVDQFELDELGEVGISLGFQRSDISQPEAESRQTGPTSNSRPACLITDGLAQYTDQTNGGTFTGFSNNPETTDRGDDDCDDFNDRRNPANLATRGSDTEGVDTTIDPATGLAIDAGTPFVFAPSQRHFRQNDTHDTRDAFFGQLRWQPNNRLDINLDVQWSERSQEERRSDLTFNGGRRNDTSLNVAGTDTTSLDSLITNGNGGILRAITDNSIEIQGGDFARVETYLGGGLNVEYEVNDRLTVSADYSHSNTE